MSRKRNVESEGGVVFIDPKMKALSSLDGEIGWLAAFPYGLQHVLAMFVANLAPIAIIAAAAGLPEDLRATLIQNAMFIAGIGTFVQLFPLWRVGSGLPIVMGISFTFVSVACTIAATQGYGALVGAVIVGGLIEGLLGLFARWWRRIITPIVAAVVVTSIGFSLLGVGAASFGGGSGARFNKDGLSCVQVHMTNTSNLPIESMEIEFPYMVEQYTLVPDSGGPGKFRGGLSMSKDIRVLGHDSQFTIKADRQKTPPWGLFGGQPGLPGVITIYPGTDQEAVIDSKKSGTTLKSGGVLRCQMPGAGGYGNPLERDRALIVHDLEEGYITPESALRDYGLTEEDLAQIEVFGKT